MSPPRSIARPSRRERTGFSVLLALVAFLSGAAALVAQVLWVRRLGEILGSGVYAVTTVLAVFFLGLGVGAHVLGARVDRARAPLRWFVTLELVIGASGALFPFVSAALDGLFATLVPGEAPLLPSLIGRSIAAGILLVVPSFAMGGTMPVLARHAVRAYEDIAPRLGLLYGSNTLGAAAGALAATFVLLPHLGFRAACLSAAAANLAAAFVAWAALRAPAAAEDRPNRSPSADHTAVANEAEARSAGALLRVPLAAAFTSGLLFVSLEVLWTRALAARFLGTVYSFATILAVLLAALAVGSFVTPWLTRRGGGRRTYAWMFLLAGGASLASVVLVASVPGDLAYGADRAIPFTGRQWIEARRAASVVWLPSLLFGLAFPLLLVTSTRELRGLGASIGRVTLANTAGTVLAPILTSFVLLPALGLRNTFLTIGWLGVAFAAVVLARWSRMRGSTLALFITAGVGPAILFSLAGRADLRLWRHTSADTLVHYEEGTLGAVAVGEEPDGTVFLKLDNTYRLGDTRTKFAQQRQGFVPLLLHANPRRVLFLGVGTGSSTGAAAAFGGIAVDGIDLIPELPRVFPLFREINFDLGSRLADGTVRFFPADARHFVRATDARYDVIVGDLFVPWRSGEGAMYTREHFAAVREALAPGGLFCQWLPLYQLRPEEFRTITATFAAVFPELSLWWLYYNAEEPAVGLVGSLDPPRFSADSLFARMRESNRNTPLVEAGLRDPRSVLGSRIAGTARLREWTNGVDIETQDRPRIEFSAARGTFGNLPERSRRNLVEIFKLMTPVDIDDPSYAPLGEHVVSVIRGYQRGISFFLRGRFADLYTTDHAEAMNAYATALRDVPDSTPISLVLEQSVQRAIRERRLDLADTGIRAFLAVPAHVYVGRYYAAERALAMGDSTHAIEELRLALSANPNHEDSRRLLTSLGGASGSAP